MYALHLQAAAAAPPRESDNHTREQAAAQLRRPFLRLRATQVSMCAYHVNTHALYTSGTRITHIRGNHLRLTHDWLAEAAAIVAGRLIDATVAATPGVDLCTCLHVFQ